MQEWLLKQRCPSQNLWEALWSWEDVIKKGFFIKLAWTPKGFPIDIIPQGMS